MRKCFVLIRKEIGIYTTFAAFKIEICGTIFKRYLHKNETLHTPPFLKNDLLQHYLSQDMRQMASVSVWSVIF